MNLAIEFKKRTEAHRELHRELQRAKKGARKALEDEKIKRYVDKHLADLIKRSEEHPGRTCDSIKVEATKSACNYRECSFKELTTKAQALYTRLEDEGFKVEIHQWQETDWDEPGAFVGGWKLVISW